MDGLNELMKSQSMQTYLSAIVSNVRTIAGKGYGSDVHLASWEAIGKVYPTDSESARDNLDNNTLEKALGGLPRTKE
jgi:hypothetical protein